jgi:hypothetical protein
MPARGKPSASRWSFKADLLLMDDRAGRECALRLDLPVTGTLGVLEQADVEGLLADLPGTLAELQASGFYVSGRLTDAVLRRWRERRSDTGFSTRSAS